MKPLAAALAGAVIATAGTAVATDAFSDQPIPEQIATLRDRITYLEQTSASQGADIRDLRSALDAQGELIDQNTSMRQWLVRCMHFDAFDWVRRDGRLVIAKRPQRGSRVWVAFVPVRCTQWGDTHRRR